MSVVEDINAAVGPSLADLFEAAARKARNQALEEAAKIHDERVNDLRQNLRFARSTDQKASIEHAITIHEDSATAIRVLIAPAGEG